MRILLVDDNAMNVDLFADVLEAAGHNVAVERDGTSGKARALKDAFDLVILDVQLPGLDGITVCRDLRAAGVAGPILAVSSSAMPEQVERGMAAGFDAYLTKPISPADLRETVSRYGGS